jgi:hypothetical protein
MISALGHAAYAIDRQLDRFERSAERVARPGASTDYVQETVRQMSAEVAVKANVKVARAADQMVGVLFDVIA